MKKTTAYKLLKNASSISSIKAIGKIVLEALKCNF